MCAPVCVCVIRVATSPHSAVCVCQVVALCKDHRIVTLDLEGGTCWSASEPGRASTLALSRDGRHVLVNLQVKCPRLCVTVCVCVPVSPPLNGAFLGE